MPLIAQQQLTKPASMPAPTGGIDSISNLFGMDIRSSILSINIDATTRGLRVRPGYTEYANGFLGLGIQTILPFKGSMDDGTEDRLFCANSDGIYDISASTTTPTKDVDWAIKATPSGRCTYSQFTNDNGDHLLLVCDEENGLNVYTEATGLWTVPAIVGPAGGAADLAFVMTWKNRVWYIEKNSTSAWYSDVGVFAGTLTEFNFGSRFRYGGILTVLADWTLDAGEGPDDYIVAISSGGDVIVYQGTDPSSSSTFGIIGLWFLGAMPFGRRITSLYGGDLLVLSTYGLISMTAILRGVDPFSLEASLSWKIQAFINDVMTRTKDVFGWEIKIHPSISRLVISSPEETALSLPAKQFTYDLNLKAWSIWEGVPIITSEQYQSEFYFGAKTINVWKLEGPIDNVELDTPTPLQIDFQLLTSFQDLETPEQFKRVAFIRPIFVAQSLPSYNVDARYDYNTEDLAIPPLASAGGVGVWDTGLWNIAIWGGGAVAFQPPRGSFGIGKTVAIGLRGKSQVETTLIAIGVMWEDGGLL